MILGIWIVVAIMIVIGIGTFAILRGRQEEPVVSETAKISREEAIAIANKAEGGFKGSEITAELVLGRWLTDGMSMDTWHVSTNDPRDCVYVIGARNGTILSTHAVEDIKS